ncbi:hypothetical protein SDC9_126382 [bioreactor metagenome]|uniref:Uncharacterized protein n=1 Tax=bioreactor metagenome TaxID=1076179 RepID=A0A645CR32_9ZZZZ
MYFVFFYDIWIFELFSQLISFFNILLTKNIFPKTFDFVSNIPFLVISNAFINVIK